MLSDLTAQQWMVSFGFICCSAFICGWIADRILGYAAFGVIGNWLMLLVGAYLGLYSYNAFGYRFHWDPPMTIAIAFGGALVMLFLSLSAKAAFKL
ncbi:MAG: hypothetical protein H6888_12115 [Nitratireductor sp.]|nr:hypothetical protein [Nitratireductor sp.]MCC0021803.1 hypothetical protein [Nitratireductor sp.]